MNTLVRHRHHTSRLAPTVTLLQGLVALGLLLGFLSGCASPPRIDHSAKQTSTVLQHLESTFLGRLFSQAVQAHPEQSGFLLLDKGEESLLWRGGLADAAVASIDAQYFIWQDDNVGSIAAERLLRAAERGVRVRVLLDDFPLNTEPEYLVHLDAHPLIEIRVYNPLGATYGQQTVREVAVLRDFRRLNRRMHNKVFIADDTAAIIGGRNIADQYFDMHTGYNFRDRDVLAAGPVVQQVSHSFDSYWNSEWSAPIDQLIETTSDPSARAVYYAELHQYAAHPENLPLRFYSALDQVQQRLLELPDQMTWAKALVIYDIPGKNDDPERLDAFGESGKILTNLALRSQQEILAESPYAFFMPGTFEVVETLQQRGVRIRLITNSLAATDLVPVFAGYAKQRHEMLAKGIELFEMKPMPALQEQLMDRYAMLTDKPPIALHAKTAVFDRQVVFIGSFNMDPRSTHLNTEIGLVIFSQPFAERLAAILEQDLRPENSWQVQVDENGDLLWRGENDGKPTLFRSDPEAGAARKAKLRFYSLLPLADYL